MSSKPRPPNASGPNGLRGGIKQFSNKTATGPWLENYGGAQGYKRGFSSADYQTEAQYAQLGATLKTSGYYGAELPDTLEKSLNPFKYEGTQGPDAWKSNTALMGEPVLCRDKEEEQRTFMKPKMSPNELEQYRKKWTVDPETFRSIHYTTETRSSASLAVQTKFAVHSVRLLPGSPKPLELLRDKLIEKFGFFAFSVVKSVYSKIDEMTVQDFRKSISSGLQIDMKLFEINQIIAFITPSQTLVPIEKFVSAIRGNIIGYDRNQSETIFNRLSQGSNTLDLISALQEKANYKFVPEVIEGIKHYCIVYASNPNQMTKEEFVSLFYDMYAANPSFYAETIKDLWKTK